MSMCLVKYHKKNVIILIDEYDVPLENAWFPRSYWSNTSSNSIIWELIEEADFETRNAETDRGAEL